MPVVRIGTGRTLIGKGQIAALTLTATTTGAGQTVTIHRMTPATGKSLTILWGDGNSTVVAAGDTAAKSNVYAATGTYSITVTAARDIVQIDLHDSKLSGFKSSELAASAITYFTCYSLGAAVASVVNSSHMSGWTPTFWYLHSMPAGNYAIDSSHMSGWTPTQWYLYSMPAGNYAIDSSHMALWTPTYWYLFSMPAGTYSIDSSHMSGWTPTTWYLLSITGGGAGWTLAAANFAGFVRCTIFQIQGNALTQAQVNAVLYGMYQATLSRTVTGGTINVGGTNAAPSGVYQAAAACPVDAATPGKEVAHELLNNGCGAIAAGETWATVTFSV